MLTPLLEGYAGLAVDPAALTAMAGYGAARAQELAAPYLASAQQAIGLLAL